MLTMIPLQISEYSFLVLIASILQIIARVQELRHSLYGASANLQTMGLIGLCLYEGRDEGVNSNLKTFKFKRTPYTRVILIECSLSKWSLFVHVF